jgi:hypothetical protein
MKTIKELNEKAWYRLIKVFYVLLYLPYLFLLIVAYNTGRDFHPPVYPKTIEAALNDPEFYKLSDFDKRNVLTAIDNDFKDLDYGEQSQLIHNIKQIDIKTKEIVKPKRVVMEMVTDANGEKGFWDGKRFVPLDSLKKVASEGNEVGYYSKETGFILTDETEGQTRESKNKIITLFAIDRKIPLSEKGAGGKYIYAPFYTRNIGRTIFNALIVTLYYVLLMEIIRRIFYYVVVGTLFPKE